MQKHCFFLILFFYCMADFGFAQKQIVVRTSYYIVDSTYDAAPNVQVQNILNDFKPIVDERVSKKIGISAQPMIASMPESLLTNLACDILLKKGSEILKEPADLSLLNIGGFRAELPEGDVTWGTLYNIFPFDNTMQIAFIKGIYLRQLFDMFVEKQMQPMSGVVLKIHDGKLKEALIGGEPLNDEKVYKLVTVNFLILGGDGLTMLKKAERYVTTQLGLREIIGEYFIEKYKRGLAVDSSIDGRVIFE